MRAASDGGDLTVARITPPANLLQPLRTWWAQHVIADDPLETIQPAADMPAHIRAGWEHEPIRVPHHWPLYILAFLIGLLGFGLGGCSTGPRAAAPAAQTCPPMPLHRVDARAARSWQDIIDARNAELADAAIKACRLQRGGL